MCSLYGQVEVTTGKYKGQQGTVLKCLRDRNQVVVEGANVVRRTHTLPHCLSVSDCASLSCSNPG